MSATIIAELKRTGPNFTLSGATATRELQIAGTAAEKEQLLSDLFDVGFVPGQGFTTKQRARHPDHDWMSAVSCNFEVWEPHDPPHSGTEYEFVKAVVSYEGRQLEGNQDPDNDPETPSGTFLSHDREASIEMMTIPNHGFVWSTAPKDPLPADIDTAIKIPTITHRLTWSNVTEPPWAALREKIGCINTNAFFGAEPETVLFVGYSSQIDYDTDGVALYTLVYEFVERNITYDPGGGGAVVPGIGWNEFFRPGHATPWQRLENASTGSTNTYATVTFLELFDFAVVV